MYVIDCISTFYIQGISVDWSAERRLQRESETAETHRSDSDDAAWRSPTEHVRSERKSTWIAHSIRTGK